MTVRRAVAALMRSRQALASIEDQLDALLVSLRESPKVDPQAADRLHGASEEVSTSLEVTLGQLRQELPKKV